MGRTSAPRSFWYRSWFTLAFAIVSSSLSPPTSQAEEVFVHGMHGAFGGFGANGPSGGVGGNGGPGQPATAAAGADSSNVAYAAGGNGGDGGKGGNATQPGGLNGNGGDGGNGADGTATATANGPGASISAWAEADGGWAGSGGQPGHYLYAGGQALIGLPGQAANAHAGASANNSQPGGSAYATGFAYGGNGGVGRLHGTHGGAATIDTISAVANGGLASATAEVQGGAGGSGTNGGNGGNGAPVTLVNKVTGSTTGTLLLHQQATGGGAGSGSFPTGAPGTAGAASSSLTLSDSAASSIDGTVIATGGNGGELFGGVPSGDGGPAISNIDITAQGSVQADAGSGGGNGGVFGQFSNGGDATATAYGASTGGAVLAQASGLAGLGAGIEGRSGLGTATADALTNQGRSATAQAGSTGRNVTVTARSRTSGGPIASILVTGRATNHVDLGARTIASIGQGFAAGGFPSWHSLGNTDGLPLQNNVSNALAGDPIVTAANNAPARTPLALLELQLKTPGGVPGPPPTLSVTADYSFNLNQLEAGNLLIGLLDPTSSGPTFTSLHFTIRREGATVEDQTFTTQVAALEYFNDRVLDLGVIDNGVIGTLDLSISLEMISPNSDTRFNTTLLVVGPNISPDYNNDGTVDAGDYALWRKYPNLYGGPAAYTTWRSNFGNPPGTGAGNDLASSAVPEPATFVLLIMAAAGTCLQRNRPAAI